MPAGGRSTFDGNPNLSPPVTAGYRPGPDDFDGCAMQNLGGSPPKPGSMPTAPLHNTYGLEIVSLGRMTAWGSISVVAQDGPTVAYWRVAANLIVANPFTVTRNAAGDYTITYANNLFPSPNGQARAFLNAVLGAHNYSIGCVNVSNGVHVTTTQDGALTDINFTVDFQ